MNINEMKIGSTYTFSTYSPAFLGARLSNVKLQSVCDVAIARLLMPVDQIYAQVFPSLPAGAVVDISSQQFYVFKELNGNRVVMAGQWIIEGSIELIQHVAYTVHIPNADEGSKDKISRALQAVGIMDFTIETT